jgi:hypothetical protein
MALGIKEMITGLFEPARKLISEFVVDKDKRAELEAAIAMAQLGFRKSYIALEEQLIKAKAAIIVAEAQSESWLTSNWRPLTMITFVMLIVARWLGLTEDVSEELELELLGLVKIGLGGYVIGRSAEKIAPGLMNFFGNKKREDN